MIGPEAVAHTVRPDTSVSSVKASTPPCRLVASPIALTVASSLRPGFTPAGSVASTCTMAMFFDESVLRSTLMLRVSNKFDSKRRAASIESPVPCRPTTRPMPITELSSWPRTAARALIGVPKSPAGRVRPSGAKRGSLVHAALDTVFGCVGACTGACNGACTTVTGSVLSCGAAGAWASGMRSMKIEVHIVS